MEGIGFIIFLAILWGVYKIAHDIGVKTGTREGEKRGYDAGIVEGVRVATMALTNPEELEYEAKIKNLVDSEFNNY